MQQIIGFRDGHLVGDEPLVVRAEPLADGWTIVADGRDGAQRMQLRQPDRDRPLPPVLDAAAFCVLPLAMHARQALHVDGPLTRSALRNLRELSEAFANWDSDRFAAVEVSCETVVDDAPPSGRSCIAAWSGDLRSSFAATGGEDAAALAGYRPDTAVHVLGLGHPPPDRDAMRRIVDAFREAGVDLVMVSTDAASSGFLDPVIGALPVVAAALHLVGDGRAAMAVHAEASAMRAQLIRPRRHPTPGDQFSGDRIDVASVGGTASLPHMAGWLAQQPHLRPLLAGCRATGFREPRCGRCGDCRRTDLGLLGAGLGQAGGRAAWAFDPNDPDMETEGILALADWRGPRLAKWRLAAGLVRAEIRRAKRDRAIWQSAMRGEAEPWPR